MSYLVLARRWRPQTFDEVIGQKHVTRTLVNALVSGRLAQGFLFAGTRGVGKTSVARILAKAINCLGPVETAPCNECRSCREIDQGRSVDIQEIDGASNTGVDHVRELRENARYLPASAKRKVYIIDEVHMLSKGAFNALLKTLEEPPEHVVFIFATTEVHKVPATILSRCQRYDFRPVPPRDIADHLLTVAAGENLSLERGAAAILARAAKGSIRDALSLLDQTVSFAGPAISEEHVQDVLGMVDPKMVWELAGAVIRGEVKDVLAGVEKVSRHGHDWRVVYGELMTHFRNLIVLKVEPEEGAETLGLSPAEAAELSAQAEAATAETLQLCLQGLLDGERLLRTTDQPRFAFELALLKLTHMTPVVGLDEILTKLDGLKANLDRGETEAPTRPDPPSPPPSRPEPGPAVADPDAEDDEPNGPPEAALEGTAARQNDRRNPIRHWNQFLASLKQTDPKAASLLAQTKPRRVEDGALVLEQSNGFDFLDDSDRRRRLEGLAAEYFGRPLSLKLVLADAGGKKNDLDPDRRALEREALDHPMVRAAVEIFGGRPAKVNPIE